MGADSETTSETPASGKKVDFHLTESSGSYELVLGSVIFGLIGLLIDRRIGTTPVFLLSFTIAGMAGASISIYYRYKYRIAQIQAETAALKSSTSRVRR